MPGKLKSTKSQERGVGSVTARQAQRAGEPRPKANERYTSPERLQKIFAALDKLFPQAECALRHDNAFQLLVATILSAQCTDERVNKVTPGLFQKFPTPHGLCRIGAARSGRGNPLHRVLPQQIQEHYRNGQEAGCGFRRPGSPNDGGDADFAGSGAKDGERGARDSLRYPHGRRRGHARVPHRASAETLQSEDAGKS